MLEEQTIVFRRNEQIDFKEIHAFQLQKREITYMAMTFEET